jgi:hypothetical protein
MAVASSNFPMPLYHYTSQKGLLGIIHDRRIWATNVLFLNDSTELNYAIRLVQENITKRLEQENLDKGESRFLEDLSEDLDNFNTPTHQSFDGIYVCSFSQNRDQLSQWRGYCPDGSGFTIAFDFESSLRDIVKEQDFTLVKCVYDENKQLEMIEDFLKEALDYFHEHKNDWMLIAKKVWDDFLALAPILKHPKFIEENEWRLVSKPKSLDCVQFRVGKSIFVPYIEIRLTEPQDDSNDKKPLSCIPEICFGPTLHPHLSRIALENMLQKERVYKVVDVDGKSVRRKCEVVESDIPYRVQ